MAEDFGSHTTSRPGRQRRSVLQLSAVITAIALVSTGCGNRADTSGVAAQEPQGAVTGQTAVDSSVPGAVDPTGGTAVDTGAVPAASGAPADPGAGGTAGTTPGEQPAGGAGTKPDANGKGQGTKPVVKNTGDCSKPIVIGSVGEYSGVLGSIETAGTTAVAAWTAATNAAGGLNCHQVKYIVYDAGGDPSRQQALTRRAVEQDGVIAFVYSGYALAGQAAVNYIQEKKIPMIGEEGGNAWSCQNSMYFPIMSSCAEGTEGNYAMLAKAMPSKDNKVAAITCVEVPYCSFYHDNAEANAKKYGLDLVYNGSISLTQPDYTSACLLAQRAGASRVVFGGDSTAMTRFMTSCSSVNYKPILVGPGTAFTPTAPSVPELAGAWTASGVKIGPASDPAVAVLMQVLKKYAPGLALGPNGGIGWVSAKVFAQALSGVTGNPTSQDVLNGLYAMKGYTADGLTRPLTFKRDGVYAPDPRCWFPLEVKNKQWVSSPKLCA